VVGGQRNVAVAIVCWWSHSQPGFWLLTVASGAEWLFRGLRSGGTPIGSFLSGALDSGDSVRKLRQKALS
jgi:hypothetical protein